MEVVFIRHAESENNLLHVRLRAEHAPDIAAGDNLFHQHRLHDPHLTPLGLEQSLLVARRLARDYPDTEEVWVSYLSRALETASAIQSALTKSTVVVMHDINECGGSYRYDGATDRFVSEPGTSRADVRKEYPSFTFYNHCFEDEQPPPQDDCEETRGWYTGSGKESPDDAMRRARGLVTRLEARASRSNNTRPPLLVVTHGDFFKLIVRVLESKRGLVVERPVATRTPAEDTDDGVLVDTKPSDTWIPNTSVSRFALVRCEMTGAWSWTAALFADASHLADAPPRCV